jgi:hypothetical protein
MIKFSGKGLICPGFPPYKRRLIFNVICGEAGIGPMAIGNLAANLPNVRDSPGKSTSFCSQI